MLLPQLSIITNINKCEYRIKKTVNSNTKYTLLFPSHKLDANNLMNIIFKREKNIK